MCQLCFCGATQAAYGQLGHFQHRYPPWGLEERNWENPVFGTQLSRTFMHFTLGRQESECTLSKLSCLWLLAANKLQVPAGIRLVKVGLHPPVRLS